MVISVAQQEANRRNAQKSTGPKTPEGKATTSMNALKHGLCARRTPIRGESEEEFHALCDALEAEWQPQTPSEQFFVEQMATSQWILARIANRENMAFEILLGADSLHDHSYRDQVEFYARQKTRYERAYAKAVRDLQQLRKSRRAEAVKQASKAEAAKPRPPQPEAVDPPAPTPWPEQPQAAQANVS